MPTTATYRNPLTRQGCADPAAMKHGGRYYVYATGRAPDGRCFLIYRSEDLVRWEYVAGALDPLAAGWPHYWAPECWYSNGVFHLYYSVGDEAHMEIRLATSLLPEGPYADSGRKLTGEEFAIDPHVFEDDDGSRWLFYATDYLTHSHIGTGTACDRFLDPFTLERRPRPVTRPRYSWQVYDPRRAEKGNVCWHTVEGPCVLKHKGRYYQMFSGGNWRDLSYGVSYAVSDSLERPDEWVQTCDGVIEKPVIGTLPGRVVGPGHNTVVRGPDNRQLYCVYHRWADDASDRLLCIDRLEFVGDRIIVLGPSHDDEPAPLAPFASGFRAGADGAPEGWKADSGEWSVADGRVEPLRADVFSRLVLEVPAPSFLMETSLRVAAEARSGLAGVALRGSGGKLLRCLFDLSERSLHVDQPGSPDDGPPGPRMPKDFDPGALHTFRVETQERHARVSVDGFEVFATDSLVEEPVAVSLITDGTSAAFSGFALTVGWEDRFDGPSGDPAVIGWASEQGGAWRIEQQALVHGGGAFAVIAKGPFLRTYELVVNALARDAGEGPANATIFPCWRWDDIGPQVSIVRDDRLWFASVEGAGIAPQRFPLGPDRDPRAWQHWRFRKESGALAIQLGKERLGTIAVPDRPSTVALGGSGSGAAFELVRVTAIGAAPGEPFRARA